MPFLLGDLALDLERNIRDDAQFQAFRNRPEIEALGWPESPLRQWLWDFGDRDAFVDDYGAIDLSHVVWTPEGIDAAEFDTMPTGSRDAGWIDEAAAHHRHWVKVKSRSRPEVRTSWEEAGTWIVPPVLIERSLLEPSATGLQVVEGRTRVGILRGRRRDGLLVAPRQRAWVGRARS